jgi:2-O-methyltransferase
MEKKLTVIMWDNNCMETLKDSLYCLSKISNKEEIEFIFIEWGDRVNNEVINYDFIKIIHINSENPFDAGLEWNLGLYLAKTEWVSYNNCDLIPTDHYEKILNEIDKEKNIIWFKGGVGDSGNSFTVKKNEFIKLVDGWSWNTDTTIKNYSEFIKEWIPNNKYTISDDIDKKIFKELLNKENPLILDIGCYDGSDTIEFKKLFKSPKLYCFEADERSVKIFNKNIEINSVDDITLIKKAVSNTDGKVSWYSSDSETRRHDKEYGVQNFWSASSSIKKPKDCLSVFSDITYSEKKIDSIKLDTWYNNELLSEPIDLLWVDVNGGEKELIQGGYDSMNKSKYIYIEFCKTNNVELFEGAISKKELLDKLQNFEEIGTFSYKGNYGNLLLKNKKYD